jgi:hypothetical protein
VSRASATRAPGSSARSSPGMPSDRIAWLACCKQVLFGRRAV